MFKKLFAIMAAGSLLVGGAAQAAPTATTYVFGLSIEGLAPITIGGSGTVSVGASTTIIPAGFVNLGAAITIPVSATTAIAQIKATKLSNLTGTFSAGGAGGLGETCPAAAGEACVANTGVGGQMALTGTVFVSVIPDVVVIPVNLNGALIGQGGSTNAPFTIDAAPWTTGVASVNTGVNAAVISGTNSNTTGGPLTLVTPTFVLALGNLLPIFTTLTLGQGSHAPVPEPGSLLLIGAGFAGLALLGRRRK